MRNAGKLGRKLLLATASMAALSRAQSPPARPEFEVASLKPNPSGLAKFGIRVLPGGKLTATNISLKRLIAMAYSLTDYQIFGNTNLIESQRYDLQANAPGPAELAQLRLMVQSLLDERFKLKFHRETRELPIYSLVLAKSGVKGGPGLVEDSLGDCSAAITPQDAPANGSSVPSVACGTVNPGFGRINGRRGRISQLADRLSTILGRTVVDKTGMNGTYDIVLTFTPDADLIQQLPPGALAPDLSGPSIFTALQEQLGLKLEGGKGPVEVIVVDSAEKPAAN